MPRGSVARLSTWMEYLNAYRKKHPEKSMRQCMKDASEGYKATKKPK
jgi:hypothetical protein